MNIKKLLLVPALIMLLSPIVASAQSVEVPHYINFQSVLRDDSGNLIEDGPVDLTIKVLDQDGTEIYIEQQPGVQVVRSSVNIMIGEGIVPGSSPMAPTGGIPLIAMDPASGTKRLQVQFGSNLPSEPMELTSVPYAMYAQTALGLVADIAEDAIPATFVTETELATAVDEHSKLDIVIAHPIGDLPASRISGQIANSQIADSAVTTDKIQNGTIALVDLGSNGCVAGQVMKSDGVSWVCAADIDTDTNTTYSGGDGLTLTGTTFDVDFAGTGSATTAARSDHTHTAADVGAATSADLNGLATTVADHEGRIDALEGGLVDADIPDTIARDAEVPSLVPQYMRPIAFGSIGPAGDGNGACPGSSDSKRVSWYNINDSVQTTPNTHNCCTVTFENPASNNDYSVLITRSDTDDSPDNSPIVVSGSKTTSGFKVCLGYDSVSADVVVFGK